MSDNTSTARTSTEYESDLATEHEGAVAVEKQAELALILQLQASSIEARLNDEPHKVFDSRPPLRDPDLDLGLFNTLLNLRRPQDGVPPNTTQASTPINMFDLTAFVQALDEIASSLPEPVHTSGIARATLPAPSPIARPVESPSYDPASPYRAAPRVSYLERHFSSYDPLPCFKDYNAPQHEKLRQKFYNTPNRITAQRTTQQFGAPGKASDAAYEIAVRNIGIKYGIKREDLELNQTRATENQEDLELDQARATDN